MKNNMMLKRPSGGGNSFSNLSSSIVRIPFRAMYTNTVSNSAAYTAVEVPLTIANLGSRVVDIGDVFTQFRLKSLHIESVACNNVAAPAGSPSMIHGLAFIASDGSDFVKPAALSEVCDLPSFNYGNLYEKVSLKVPTSLLYPDTPTKWYSTSSNGQFIMAGTLQHFINAGVASTAVAYTTFVCLKGVIELNGPVDPNDVPLDALERHYARLKMRIDKRKEEHPEELFDSFDEKDNKGKSENKSIPPKRGYFL